MKAYHIIDDRIMLRDHQGDLFEFKLIPDGAQMELRLVGLPSWVRTGPPKHAEARIDFARIAVRRIVEANKLAG